MGYKTAADSKVTDETTHFARKAVIISILVLVTLSVIVISALSTFIH